MKKPALRFVSYCLLAFSLTAMSLSLSSCKNEVESVEPETTAETATDENARKKAIDFYYGADLSYVNQILDYGGVYMDKGKVRNPYYIFRKHGANMARFRLWHNPTWTKEIYGAEGKKLYNNLADVEKGMIQARLLGMNLLLDLHYSDEWADPLNQKVPAAWKDIKDIEVLKDSVYRYTLKTLNHLNRRGLMPNMIQIGNETNCGMLFTKAQAGFPTCNSCKGEWERLGAVINSAIRAVKEVSCRSYIKTKIALHVADPKNTDWWFNDLINKGNVTDFDVIGFSYYPLWHTTVKLNQLSDNIANVRNKYGKEVIVLETAYPWSTGWNDNYNNLFGSGNTPVANYPFTEQGQYDFMKALAQEVKDGGGKGVIYWEPAWITSSMKDLWGQGSAWENATFFDFQGNTIKGIDWMNDKEVIE